MQVAIVSDSHVPSRAQRIPEEFRERIRTADHVLHAGDFDSTGALADARDLASELTAVHGNMDSDYGLSSVATVDFGGVTFVVTHGSGPPHRWAARVIETARETVDDPDVAVAGHTHEVVDETEDDVRLLNPGSVTGATPADRPTMLTADVADGDLAVTVHEL